MKNIFKKLTLLCCLLLSQWNSNAHADGLNSENFEPALDNHSAILWETPRTMPAGGLLLGYTLSYALHPVELGDGQTTRIPISSHLQVNHFAASYALFNWFELGLSVPLALYSAPSAADGYLPAMSSRNRNFFFMGDTRFRAKFSLVPFLNDDFYGVGFLASVNVPTGNRAAMLSDDTLKVTVEMPVSMAFLSGSYELYFTPGVSLWSSPNRVTASPVNGETTVLMAKSQSLLLSLGSRYWFFGNPKTMDAGSLFADLGIRGDYANFIPSLGNNTSPTEWSAGAGFVTLPGLSLHGAFGTGIGVGVGAPMSRVVGGIRYTMLPKAAEPDDEKFETLLSSSSYSDLEFEELIKQAQAEPMPPQLGEDDSYLQLKAHGQVIDIGVIRFEFNSAKLTSQAKQVVVRLHDELSRQKPFRVHISGHTDSIGSYNYNLALSKKRAEAVKSELVRLGEDSSIISTEGFSYKYPVASNGSKTGRAQNRRIEVAINNESFRKTNYSAQEERQMQEWIAPKGKKPHSNK